VKTHATTRKQQRTAVDITCTPKQTKTMNFVPGVFRGGKDLKDPRRDSDHKAEFHRAVTFHRAKRSKPSLPKMPWEGLEK